MKKGILIGILAAALLLLSGCGISGKVPRLEIIRSAWRFDNIVIALRDKYKIAEDAYTTVDTENGYDIIIHCERTDEK